MDMADFIYRKAGAAASWGLRFLFTAIVLVVLAAPAPALSPSQVLVIANSEIAESVELARYYCDRRKVPQENIIALPLGSKLRDGINRVDYEKKLAGAIRDKLSTLEFAGRIRCLVTTYGVPFKVGRRKARESESKALARFKSLSEIKGSKLAGILWQLKLLGQGNLPKVDSKKPSVKNVLKVIDSENDKALARIRKLSVRSTKRSQLAKWVEYQGQIYGESKGLEAAWLYLAGKTQEMEQAKAEQHDMDRQSREIILRAAKEGWSIDELFEGGYFDSLEEVSGLKGVLGYLDGRMDFLSGRETEASVDSELSMVLFGNYELYRWQPNGLRNRAQIWDFKTLMVSRLDGPSFEIARGLVDKALSAERKGLKGIAYFDSRGITDVGNAHSFGYYDQSLRELAGVTRTAASLMVRQELTEKLFGIGQCPRTAIYCGWYSLKKYVDAFDFVDGAVGFHIASFEAVKLRDAMSSQWCPSMLRDGITVTLGPVAEPYLHSFPEPKRFFSELYAGRCVAEAFYTTKPFNSWQFVLIGDPLYRPFGITGGRLVSETVVD